MPSQKVSDFVQSNGARLYYEKQGSGLSLLFIAGSTGDAGNFTRSAALLADEFTVVTYDRRGNSRSKRPEGWATTSVAEQADDAAGIIEALQLRPAVIFGASAGGPIALDLMIRHQRLIRAGILQDPVVSSRRTRTSHERSAREIERGDRLVAFHGWELAKKLVQGLPASEVIEQRLDRNTGADEHGCATKDVRVAVHDVAWLAHTGFSVYARSNRAYNSGIQPTENLPRKSRHF